MLVKFFLQKIEDFFLDFPSTLCTPSIRPPLLRLTFHVSLYRALDGDLFILLNQLHVNVYGKRKDKTSLICHKFSNIIVALVNVDLLNMQPASQRPTCIRAVTVSSSSVIDDFYLPIDTRQRGESALALFPLVVSSARSQQWRGRVAPLLRIHACCFQSIAGAERSRRASPPTPASVEIQAPDRLIGTHPGVASSCTSVASSCTGDLRQT